MTEPDGSRKRVAIILIVLGGVLTLAAQVPALISSRSYLGLMNGWLALTMLGLLVLIIGTFTDRGATRRLGLTLTAIAVVIAALTIGRYFSVLNHEVF